MHLIGKLFASSLESWAENVFQKSFFFTSEFTILLFIITLTLQLIKTADDTAHPVYFV